MGFRMFHTSGCAIRIVGSSMSPDKPLTSGSSPCTASHSLPGSTCSVNVKSSYIARYRSGMSFFFVWSWYLYCATRIDKSNLLTRTRDGLEAVWRQQDAHW